MKPLVVGLFLALVAQACSSPSGTIFKATVVQPDGEYAMPVVLGDQTGLVTAIEPAIDDRAVEGDLEVAADPDDPSAVIVTWIGGACDDDAAISFQRSGEAFLLRVSRHEPILGSCMAIALARRIRIQFSESIPVPRITAIEGL